MKPKKVKCAVCKGLFDEESPEYKDGLHEECYRGGYTRCSDSMPPYTVGEHRNSSFSEGLIPGRCAICGESTDPRYNYCSKHRQRKKR